MRIFFILLVIISLPGKAQLIHGIVLDQETKMPLSYANLGIKGKPIGGITDDSGKFSIDLTTASLSDSLVVSYVGYRSKRFLVSDLTTNKPQTIYLQPMSKVLEELVILAKKEFITIGNSNKSRMHSGWGDFTSARGRALGLLIPALEVPMKINKVVFHLYENEFDSIRIRINLFRTDRKAIFPLKEQTQNIIITTSQRRGWIEIPLPETIVFQEDLVVALEWIDAWAKPRSLEEGGSYAFTISLGKYEGLQYRREKPEEIPTLQHATLCPSIYLECVAIRK